MHDEHLTISTHEGNFGRMFAKENVYDFLYTPRPRAALAIHNNNTKNGMVRRDYIIIANGCEVSFARACL